jgi:hypothetical protein
MLKTNLFVFSIGIAIGGSLQHLAMNSMNRDVNSSLTSLESRLNSISQQLSKSRHFDYESITIPSGKVSDQSADKERWLTEMKQNIQSTLETSVRTIIQEELEIAVGNLPQGKEIMSSPEQGFDTRVEEEYKAKAYQVLNTAIGNGFLSQQDVEAYNDAMSNMSEEARFEAQRQLAVAINNGDIEVGDDIFKY